jgi:hypothetical protein
MLSSALDFDQLGGSECFHAWHMLDMLRLTCVGDSRKSSWDGGHMNVSKQTMPLLKHFLEPNNLKNSWNNS